MKRQDVVTYTKGLYTFYVGASEIINLLEQAHTVSSQPELKQRLTHAAYIEVYDLSQRLFDLYSLERIVHGTMPRGGEPLIIAPNHSSGFDMYVVGELVHGEPTTAVAKEILFLVPKLGKALKLMHSVTVKRNKKNTSSDKESLRTVTDFSGSEGYHVLIFPEGTRSKTGYMADFKMGTFHMAHQSKRSILPIYIDYGINSGNTGYYGIKPGVINVWIGEPIVVGNSTPRELYWKYTYAMYHLKWCSKHETQK